MDPLPKVLDGLNPAQCVAVTSPAPVVQILAPPGSGKTKTLTSRVAYLLSHHKYQPWNIIVATFTVKAAKEMKERIGALLGDGLESKLILGTFHSIARRYLARYGHFIGVKKGFAIADTTDSLSIIKRIVKNRNLRVDAKSAQTRISSLKAKGISHEQYAVTVRNSLYLQDYAIAYEQYQAALSTSNTLDYDDLLLRAIQLFREHPGCVANIEAVLIDEFQDTNLVQFDLMRLLAAQRKRVTIVGDPDQSIYSFRSAEVENLERMRKEYPATVVVLLEENYRSSGAILLSALAVIQQDEKRPSKALLPTHSVGTPPVLRQLSSAAQEALWIVSEIKRSLALTGGNLLTLDDYAILIRSAFLSRHIETALGNAGIPYTVRGGNRFYERIEVKIVLDYLRVVSCPDNSEALARIINVPPRRIGERSVKQLIEAAHARKLTLFSLVQRLLDGHTIPNCAVSKVAQRGLGSFISLIAAARTKVSGSDSPCSLVDLVNFLAKEISLKAYLEKSFSEDHESRWANVGELVAQAAEVGGDPVKAAEDDESLPLIPGLDQQIPSTLEDALSRFLSNIALSSEVKTDQGDGLPVAQVTISTIHAAKGLEWPVVFIAGAYDGSMPHYRAENLDEERRLLYVAITRARVLLYMSIPSLTSQGDYSLPSPFLSCKTVSPHLQDKGPLFSHNVVMDIARNLGRERPTETEIHRASKGLPSVEDDLGALYRAMSHGPSRKLNEVNGHEAEEQSTHDSKRRCMGAGGVGNGSRLPSIHAPAAHSTSTTMQSSATFSVTTTTMNSGFMSAGSHMRELDKQGLKQASGKETGFPLNKRAASRQLRRKRLGPRGSSI